jgi:hypothetical protein
MQMFKLIVKELSKLGFELLIYLIVLTLGLAVIWLSIGHLLLFAVIASIAWHFVAAYTVRQVFPVNDRASKN